jgi:hypothetical protein
VFQVWHDRHRPRHVGVPVRKGDIFMVVMATLLVATFSVLAVRLALDEIHHHLDQLEKHVCECAQRR